MSILLRFASRWVAGTELADAISRAVERNEQGMRSIINFLGEHYEERRLVEKTFSEYLKILDAIQSQGIKGCISIKPTQFGMDIGTEYCTETVLKLLKEATEREIFLWIDMEGSPYTQRTVDLYLRCLQETQDVGVCIQAYLHRSEKDLKEIVAKGGKIRLCKGAYREPAKVAIKKKREIDANFSKLMQILFKSGNWFAIASHDRKIIEEAISLGEKHGSDFEFQMLLGVRDPLKRELVEQGHRLTEYIPYGPQWLPYFSRRIRERPGNLITMFRSVIGL